MYKFVVVLTLMVISSICAAPSNSAENAALRALPAVHHEETHDDQGQFALRYVTAEGTIVEESGKLIPTPDGKSLVLVMEGKYSFVADDGKTYVTKYTAGLDGYKAEGSHLPVAPESQ